MAAGRRYAAEEAFRRLMDIDSADSGNSDNDSEASDSDDSIDNNTSFDVTETANVFRNRDSSLNTDSDPSESELENDSFQSRNGIIWSLMTTQGNSLAGRISHQNILRRSPGVKSYVRARVSTALDAWHEMIDSTIIHKVVEYSNANRPSNSPEISENDLRMFIALQYARGLYGRHIPRDFLWSKQYGIQIFKDTMPRSKFRHLSKLLRFDLKSNRSQRSTDRFTHIREVYERFTSNCASKYTPESSLTVDEQLLPLKSRCKWITFMPQKPDKYGQKYWTLVEVESKYVLAQIPYLGKDPSGNITRDLAEKVVLELVEKSGIGPGYTIIGDNFFTSLSLVKKLQSKGISYVGTVRNNKVELCDRMKSKKTLYESEFFSCTDPRAMLVSYQCKKNKNVLLMSSMHSRPSIGTHEKKKPEIVEYYNSNKCGVDVVDQMTRLYSTKTPCRRWPMAVWCNMLDIAGINSWIIYRKVTGSKIGRRAFLFRLVSELIGDTSIPTPRGDENVSPIETARPKRVLEKRKHCSSDECKNMTTTICSTCEKSVCGTCAVSSVKYALVTCNRHN